MSAFVGIVVDRCRMYTVDIQIAAASALQQMYVVRRIRLKLYIQILKRRRKLTYRIRSTTNIE